MATKQVGNDVQNKFFVYLFVVDVDDVTGPDAQLVVHVGGVVVQRSAGPDAGGVAARRSGVTKNICFIHNISKAS